VDHRRVKAELGEVSAGSDGDRRRATTGRTSVANGVTSATRRDAAAGLSNESPIDGVVGTGVWRLDGA
jgi:hypothetical protein